MIELTDREKKIILIKYIIHGVSPFADAPLDLRIKMLKSALKILGWDYDEPKLLELGKACLDFQEEVNNSLRKFLAGHTDFIKQGHIEMAKGNESIEGLLGKDFVDEALGILKKGKVD